MTIRRTARFLLVLLALAFIGSIFWSFWIDTLRPSLRQENYTFAVVETGGFLFAVLAAGLMVYSAYIFLRNMYALWMDPDFQLRVHVVQHRKEFPREVVRRARRENAAALLRAGLPALPWFGLGWGFLLIGAFLIRTAEGNL